MKKVGFIGAGNMAEAMVMGLLASKTYSKEDIILSDVNTERLETLTSKYGVLTTLDNCKAAESADIVVLCVKPAIVGSVCGEIKGVISTDKIYVSIAAGVRSSSIRAAIGSKWIKLARVMPNAPSLVLEGANCVCFGEGFTEKEETLVLQMFQALGKAFRLEDEKLMDVVTALSGSGPAFVAVFIEALCDGAVKMGLDRNLATALAVQTVCGTGRMVFLGDKHPAEIKDMVASPGGTTASGIHSLEGAGFRAAVISAVEVATKRSAELSGKES